MTSCTTVSFLRTLLKGDCYVIIEVNTRYSVISDNMTHETHQRNATARSYASLFVSVVVTGGEMPRRIRWKAAHDFEIRYHLEGSTRSFIYSSVWKTIVSLCHLRQSHLS